ncbi:MAG: sialidase family protein [Gaiellaceae bacterium]
MRLRALGVALVCAVVAGATASAAVAPTFTAPVRLGFEKGDDWEPAIAADGRGHVYALWTHYTGFAGADTGEPDPSCPTCASPHMVLQVSKDGGTTWSKPRALWPSTTRQDDPQIVVDAGNGRTVYAAFMQNDKSSQYVARSDDFGKTWRAMLVEPLQRGTDKDILAARDGHVYLVYHTQQKIFASVSHDGGATWSTHNLVGTTNSEFGVSLPSGGAVDSKGTAYFAWNGANSPGQAKGTKNLFVTRSTDGGKTWTTSLVDVSESPKQCGCIGWDYWGAQMALAVDARDRVYVLWDAAREKYGVQRLFFARSLNGGGSWIDRQEVSLAPTGTNHLFPAMAARSDGDVRIAWQDDRNGFDTGSNDPNARWNTYYRSSLDGGATWSDEAKPSQFVAGYPYKFATPQDGYAEPYGDYFEIDIDGAGTTHALWGEGISYVGPGNIWYSRGS